MPSDDRSVEDGSTGDRDDTIPPAFHEDATAVAAADAPRVIIVGGGVIGCAAARELAPDHEVLVLERGRIAEGATARAAGEVTMTPSYTDHPEIAAYANDFFRAYDGTGAFEYTETPSVELVTAEREETARARVDRLHGEGVDVAFLDTTVVEDRWPRINTSGFVGAVRFADTGHLDPYTLTTTLRADAEDRGARFRTGVTVTDLLAENNRANGTITGVGTDAGTAAAESVVAAAGWRTPDLLAPHLQLPVRPYRTQCLVLRPESSVPSSFPMGWIPGEHVYFRPEANGDLLVGGWSFAEDDPASASRSADEEFRDHVAELAPRFLRTKGALRIVDGWAGIDGATPDTRPIIDAPADALPDAPADALPDAPADALPDAPEGLVVATGFHGRGVMTAPVAAALVRSHVTGEEPPVPAAPFRLSRFESRSADFEFFSISAGED